MEMEGDRDRVNQRLQHLQKSLGEAEEGKRGAHGRLASAQTALMLQEETIRRNEREQKQAAEKLAGLERTCQSNEAERRCLQVSGQFVVFVKFTFALFFHLKRVIFKLCVTKLGVLT